MMIVILLRIDGSVCPLCQDPVSGEEWSGGHRAQCGARNTAKLSTYPAHALPCPRCGGKLRLWPAPGPASKFRCSAERGACLTNNTGSKIRNNGKNRCPSPLAVCAVGSTAVTVGSTVGSTAGPTATRVTSTCAAAASSRRPRRGVSRSSWSAASPVCVRRCFFLILLRLSTYLYTATYQATAALSEYCTLHLQHQA